MLILLKEHDSVINYIHSRIYENGRKSWYKEGASPGSWVAWDTGIKVTNTGTETTDYFLLINPKNGTPSGWDLFWVDNGSKTHQSPTFTLPPGYSIVMNGSSSDPLQSYTQSPNTDQSNIWTYYDLYWDRNWPISNEWLSGVNKYLNNDVTTPYSYVNSLNPTQKSTTFIVSWSGGDSGTGASEIYYYDIQYKQNSKGWKDWLTSTTLTSKPFQGNRGNTYYFQSRSIDKIVHFENYPEGAGDTHIYVQNIHAAPSNLTGDLVTWNNTNKLTLTWQDNFNNEDGFKIDRNDGGTWRHVGTPGQNSTSWVDDIILKIFRKLTQYINNHR